MKALVRIVQTLRAKYQVTMGCVSTKFWWENLESCRLKTESVMKGYY
jgi:hypothetical protein